MGGTVGEGACREGCELTAEVDLTPHFAELCDDPVCDAFSSRRALMP